jgi:hypothetical protein
MLIRNRGQVVSVHFGRSLGSAIYGFDDADGTPVAFNEDVDRFVVGVSDDTGADSRIIVIRRDGAVFGHSVSKLTGVPFHQYRIGDPFTFEGSRVAFNGDGDRFVVTWIYNFEPGPDDLGVTCNCRKPRLHV